MIAAEILTFTLGTRADERNAASVADDEELATSDVEGAVLEQLREFDFEQHPGHLFTDKTQRDVDRALRNLAAASKREFIDKGLRILYVALGELRWVDGAGDTRRSPLLLVPAELAAHGPRERTNVRFPPRRATRSSAGRSRRMIATSPQCLPADANCTVTEPAGLGCPPTLGSGSLANRSRECSSRLMASAAWGRFRSGIVNASMTAGCTPGAAVPSSTTRSSRTNDPRRDHAL